MPWYRRPETGRCSSAARTCRAANRPRGRDERNARVPAEIGRLHMTEQKQRRVVGFEPMDQLRAAMESGHADRIVMEHDDQRRGAIQRREQFGDAVDGVGAHRPCVLRVLIAAGVSGDPQKCPVFVMKQKRPVAVHLPVRLVGHAVRCIMVAAHRMKTHICVVGDVSVQSAEALMIRHAAMAVHKVAGVHDQIHIMRQHILRTSGDRPDRDDPDPGAACARNDGCR